MDRKQQIRYVISTLIKVNKVNETKLWEKINPGKDLIIKALFK